MIYGVAVGADALTGGMAGALFRGMRSLPCRCSLRSPGVQPARWSKVPGRASVRVRGFSRNHPVLTLLLSVGPMLIPAIPGVWPLRSPNVRAWATGTSGLALGLVMLYLVRITDASWVGFRAGQLILVSLPVLLAPVLLRAHADPVAPPSRGT